MLVTGQSNGTGQIEMASIDELVPKEHLIRKTSSAHNTDAGVMLRNLFRMFHGEIPNKTDTS
jgi:hypothetical protein